MSSSQTRGVPLFNLPDDVGYRLIELPPELQTLLESDQAPVLTLESSPSSALLRTADKTYALRQKNTSNALIILKPHTPDPSNPEEGMALISTIKETVDLEAVKDPATVLEPAGPAKNTGSKGKWHERFGRNR
ncbi:unnamed protein product [Clonostachys byssicola]|uniref:Sister chromatid cohesion protein DCC1 n=1 Tax=Clonostachys byssicola TaxID=160290 RepID=A0A9N9U2V1_9HYPO|nr:unnamed protein product [Clonostachys byssicola]